MGVLAASGVLAATIFSKLDDGVGGRGAGAAEEAGQAGQRDPKAGARASQTQGEGDRDSVQHISAVVL